MADERPRKPHPQRRHPGQSRPPPGVQKAIENFGVRDLREILDKKHGEAPNDKKNVSRSPKHIPPPDPSYNFLKDPAREKSKSPRQPQINSENPLEQSNYVNHKPHYNKFNKREHNHNNNNPSEKGVLKKSVDSTDKGQQQESPKKELKFVDQDKQASRGPRNSFRGRGARKDTGFRQQNISEPKTIETFNIKVELSTETGQRNCTLDENSKLPDIKHVPDKIDHHQHSPRGGFRGHRGGTFRGRGRGKNNNYRGGGKGFLPNVPSGRRHNDNHEETEEENSGNVESFDNKEEQDKTIDDSTQYMEKTALNLTPETSQGTEEGFSPNLSHTITITSSQFSDTDIQRSVEVTAHSDLEEGNLENNTEEVQSS